MTEDIPMLQQMGVSDMGPQHIAPVVTWLASSLAADINGRVFGVHGPKVFEYKMEQTEGVQAPPDGESLWTPALLAQALTGIEK